MPTPKFWLILALSWLTANVCYSQGVTHKVPPEVLTIVLRHTTANVEIDMDEKGDLNKDGMDDWAVVAIPLDANGDRVREDMQFFLFIGDNNSAFKLLYHFRGIPEMMGVPNFAASFGKGTLHIRSHGQSCCVLSSHETVYELRNDKLMLIKELSSIFYMLNDDGTESRPMEYIEVDYVKKTETTRIESEKDKSLNKKTVRKIKVDRLKLIEESGVL